MSIKKIIFVLWVSVMLIISTLLVCEFRFFKNQTIKLEQLKEEYSNYIIALKKRIYEYSQLNEAQTGLKKKMNKEPDSNSDNFLVVNREPDYLKKSALSYAKLHNLEWAIEKMYESETWVLNTVKPKKNKSKKKKARKNRVHLISSGFNSLDDNTDKLLDKDNIEKLVKKVQKEPIFMWPLGKSEFRLSSMFGPRRKTNGSWGFHTGIDMAAHKGTLIRAAGDGTVTQANYSSGYGNTIVLFHDGKFKTRYAHLDKILVTVGQKVKQGDLIGKVGATGNVRRGKGGDGSHLHFEVYVYSKHVNPLYFLA